MSRCVGRSSEDEDGSRARCSSCHLSTDGESHIPVLYGINVNLRVVHLVTVGEPSFEEWRNTLLGVFSNSSFRTGFDFISDRRRASVPDRIFVERTAAFAREHEDEFGACRWAVVTADLATDDVARIIKCRSGLSQVEAGYFFDLAEARRWLLCGGRVPEPFAASLRY